MKQFIQKKFLPPKFNFAFSTLQTVTYQRSKKKCNYCYKKKPEKSFDKFTTNDKMIQIAFSMYPGKIFSHTNCIKTTIKTPKTMGWQWSVKETGGVKVSCSDKILTQIKYNKIGMKVFALTVINNV